MVPLEGNTAIIQVLPTFGLLFVRKIGNNADIKKMNHGWNAAPDQRANEAATRCSLKEKECVVYIGTRVGRCEVVSESSMRNVEINLSRWKLLGLRTACLHHYALIGLEN